ncbi:COX assembly mitochondrial protein 2 [Spathaspora sp. JA1]|nr:COX assembly mitochondrial protein 2 [Spathaspora sp. JA1]
MHPQLDKNRFDTCEKLMDALEKCHQQEFLKQCLGMCNYEKDQLAQCLHYTRVEDSKDRIKSARERAKLFEEKRKRAREEEYGKDGYLAKVIDAEYKKNQNN